MSRKVVALWVFAMLLLAGLGYVAEAWFLVGSMFFYAVFFPLLWIALGVVK